MTYDRFEKIILNLKKFCNKIDSLSDTFNCDFFIELMGPLIDETVDLLSYCFKDEGNWIDYWMWELNFGKRYEQKMVQIDGKEVPLKTIKDLYNLLKRN